STRQTIAASRTRAPPRPTSRPPARPTTTAPTAPPRGATPPAERQNPRSPRRDRPMITVTCPICGRRMEGQSVADWPQFPFCSPRCKTVDLGRGLSESYGIPSEEPEDAPGSEEKEIP